jgi:hypothetical protein
MTKNKIRNFVLRKFFRGYIVTASFSYHADYVVTLTLDLGKVAAGEEGAVRYELSEKAEGGYVN